MQPTVTFTRSLIEPAHTFRATSAREMFDAKLDLSGVQFIYDVGITPTGRTPQLTVRNLTVSHDLSIKVSFPTWISADVDGEFLLNRNGERRVIQLSFRESDAKRKSQTGHFSFAQSIGLEVTPLHVMGPVYVMQFPSDI